LVIIPNKFLRLDFFFWVLQIYEFRLEAKFIGILKGIALWDWMILCELMHTGGGLKLVEWG
jgi:hypothetical protein